MIYQWILDHGPGDNFLSPLSTRNYDGAYDVYTRINRIPTFQSLDYKSLWGEKSPRHMRISTPTKYIYWTSHQWNVLTYAFVHSLQHDPVASTILIPFEWGFLLCTFQSTRNGPDSTIRLMNIKLGSCSGKPELVLRRNLALLILGT